MNKLMWGTVSALLFLTACNSSNTPTEQPVSEPVKSVEAEVQETIVEKSEKSIGDTLVEKTNDAISSSKAFVEVQSEKVKKESSEIVAKVAESEIVKEGKVLASKAVESVENISNDVGDKIAAMVDSAKGKTAPDSEKMIELAKSNGCFACHAIEKKIVGPAWQDVAKRYKDDAEARDMLIKKVKKGGRGNWTEVTGGVPMPPYSPRVSDDNITALVDFVLSL